MLLSTGGLSVQHVDTHQWAVICVCSLQEASQACQGMQQCCEFGLTARAVGVHVWSVDLISGVGFS
jgi:hypothetical protein